jgi:hypothetical protein
MHNEMIDIIFALLSLNCLKAGPLKPSGRIGFQIDPLYMNFKYRNHCISLCLYNHDIELITACNFYLQYFCMCYAINHKQGKNTYLSFQGR